MTTQRLLATATFLLLSAVHAAASECIGFSTADYLNSRQAVFIGVVKSIEPSGAQAPYGAVVRVTFAAKDTFRSKTAQFTGRQIELHQWARTGLTDWDNPFVVGREYLVFAFANEKKFPPLLQAPVAPYTARHCDAWEVTSARGMERLAELRELIR